MYDQHYISSTNHAILYAIIMFNFVLLVQGCGDVKYHLGTFMKCENHFTNKMIKLAVVANPSHLEGTPPIITDFLLACCNSDMHVCRKAVVRGEWLIIDHFE